MSKDPTFGEKRRLAEPNPLYVGAEQCSVPTPPYTTIHTTCKSTRKSRMEVSKSVRPKRMRFSKTLLWIKIDFRQAGVVIMGAGIDT